MQHQSILNKRKVIVAGGYASDGEKASSEMYNPQMDTWVDLPSLPTQRIDFKLEVFFHSHLLQLNFSIFLPLSRKRVRERKNSNVAIKFCMSRQCFASIWTWFCDTLAQFGHIFCNIKNLRLGKNIFFYPKYVQEVKSQLPRRESQRRNHQLYRHYSILTSMGSKISWLSLTFKEYVDSKRCCFIPGKVIDEIFSILRRIKEDQNPPRSSEILQELEDLSTMARDHFETKMVPTLGPEINPFQGMIDSFNSIKETVAIQNKTVASQNKKISQLTKEYKETVASLKKEFKETVASQNKKIVEQNKKIVEQNKKIVEMEEKLAGKRGKESRKRTREMESPAELESKMTTRYHLRKRKITSD